MAFNFFQVLGLRPNEVSDEEYYESIKSLYLAPESKTASSVEGVSVSFGARTIVRNNRDPKFVTEDELRSLATEYEKSFTEMWNLFKSRKQEIRKKARCEPK